MRRRWILAAALLCFVCASNAEAKKTKPKAEEVDYLDLATILIRDGNYDRAATVLAQVDLEDEKLDRGRFHLLRGLVRLNRSLFSQAAEDFKVAISNGQDQPIVRVNLAQALFYANEFAASIEAFEGVREKADTIPGTFLLRADAHWRLEQYEEGWDVLLRGEALHPSFRDLQRRKAFFAIKLGLYHIGAELGRALLEGDAEATADGYMAMGSALQRSGNAREALLFLEMAHLRFPSEDKVSLELARVYKEQGHYRTAAMFLERLGVIGGNEDHLLEAGELYRLAGEPYRALPLNARIADSEKRLRQRLGILLELRQYDRITTMDDDLRRVGLLATDNIRYAVAYAYFKVGRYDRADKLLGGIRDPELFRQATELRKAMANCRNDGWAC